MPGWPGRPARPHHGVVPAVDRGDRAEPERSPSRAGVTGPAPSASAGSPDGSVRGPRALTAGGVLALQRAAGNTAAAGAVQASRAPVVQRWTNPVLSLKSNAELLDAALREGDVSALKQVDDVSSLSLNQTLQLIDLLNQKGSGWGRDATVMVKLWKSIGADLLVVANRDGGARWKQSAAKVSSLMTDLQQVADLRTQFPKDVQALAQQTLAGNRQLVVTEMTSLGISTDPAVTGAQPTAEQEAKLQDLQDAAAVVARLQAAQEHARTLNVGWRMDRDNGAPPLAATGGAEGAGFVPPAAPSGAMYVPVTYDPLSKPELTDAPPSTPLLPVLGKDNVVPYMQVDEKYRASVAMVEFFLGRFPELYAITRAGKSASTSAFAAQTDPKVARDQLGAGMHKLIGDIEGAQRKLGGDLNVLDLVPLHTRMTQNGLKPPGGTVSWNDPVPAMAAKDVVADHNFDRALAAMAIDVAANALFIIAPFTGGGALLVMLAGIGALTVKASLSADRAAALTQAAGTAAAPGTALVNDATVDTAAKEAEADKVAAELAVLQAVADVAIASAAQSGTRVAELEGKLTQKLADPLLKEGAHTRAYIDPTGRRVTQYQRETIQLLGEEHGCHSCGAHDPGPYGTWHGDHQPPTGLVTRGLATGPQILVPHCEACSNRQGNLVREVVDLWNALQQARNRPAAPGVIPPIVVTPAPPDGGT